MSKYTTRKYKASQAVLISGLSCGTEIELEMVVDYAVTPEEPTTRDHPGAPRMVEDVEMKFMGAFHEVKLDERVHIDFETRGCFNDWLLSEASEQDAIAADMAADAKFEAARDDWERW